MTMAVLRTMLLGLLRDRSALAMSFILPGLFFVIFATIFAGATGEQLRLTIALADEVGSETSERLLEALAADPALSRVGGTQLDAVDVRDLVRRGSADVGIIVRKDAQPLEDLGGLGDPPILIVTDPVRGVAAPMIAGQIQKAWFSAIPDVALRNVVELLDDDLVEWTAQQRAEISEGLERMRQDALDAREEGRTTGWGFEDLYEREDVAGRSAASNHVAYYAGAVAVLFLLFSCVHGAISLFEERDSGIMDRLLAGPARTGVLVDGKFAFLTLQGFVQVGVIFLVAWWMYGVDLPGHLGLWSITTVLASAAAAGLALMLVAACSTRRQAQTFANVMILVVSALGGSMVPRFFMPPVLQDLGWLTPNTWALEAYAAVFWRDAPASECVAPWAALAVTALIAWVSARALARRMETI